MIKRFVIFYYITILLVLLYSYPHEALCAVFPNSEETTTATVASNSDETPDLAVTPDSITYSGSGKKSNLAVSSASMKIPDSIVSISSGYVIVVDKKYQKIYVFHKDESFSKVFEARCSTGKNSGSKEVAGDAKTPN